jgi:hypothetical protein
MDKKVLYIVGGVITLGLGYMIYSKNKAKKEQDEASAKAKAEQDRLEAERIATLTKAEQDRLNDPKRKPIYEDIQNSMIFWRKQNRDSNKNDIDEINKDINKLKNIYPDAIVGDKMNYDGSITYKQAGKGTGIVTGAPRVLSDIDINRMVYETFNCMKGDLDKMNLDELELARIWNKEGEAVLSDLNIYAKLSEVAQKYPQAFYDSPCEYNKNGTSTKTPANEFYSN